MKLNLCHFPPGHPLWEEGQPECIQRYHRKVRRREFARKIGKTTGKAGISLLLGALVWAAYFAACVLPDILM